MGEARIPVRFTKSELNIKPELETKLAARNVSDIVAYPARTDTTAPTECNGEYVEIADTRSREYHESVQDDVGQIALNCWDGNMLAYTNLTSVGDENTDDQYDVYCYENNEWEKQEKQTGTFVEGDSYTCDGASEERYRTYEHIIGSNGGNEPSDPCGTDEYVSSNVCTACPAGTTNAAGDDASGVDTTCDATLCGADEYVSSNACVQCAAGETNAAGDDASGGNTTCDVFAVPGDDGGGPVVIVGTT